MPNLTTSNKFDKTDPTNVYGIDITKLENIDLFLAQLLCDLKAIAQAKRDLQHMNKRLETSTGKGQEEDIPMDLTVAGPSRTSPSVTRSPKREFTCKFQGCFKSFATAKYLNQHKVSHKPPQYPCNLCAPPKRFRRRAALVQHRRTRHLCKPYPCDYSNCNEAFSDSDELETHRSREHSKCLFCGEEFLNSAGLKLHLRKCRVLEEVIAESEAKRRNEDEQYARSPSAWSADESGTWSMSPASRRSSTGTSGYSSSPDQSF